MSQKKIKLLVVCQHFWPEAFRINDICDYLVDHDYEIDVLCGIPNYPQGNFYKGYSLFRNRKQNKSGITIRRAIEIPRGNNSNRRVFINYISFPISSIFHIPRLLRKDYDKIFMYQLSPVMMSFAGLMVGKIKRKEKIMYILDLWPENLFSVLPVKNSFFNKLVTSISHWHYRQADKIMVLSEQMKEKVTAITGLPDEKIIVLPQACEKIYEKEIHDENLTKRFADTFNIVYAGNICPAQSFDTILDAADLLKKQGHENICWIIVGEGMSYQWLREEVLKRKLDDLFVFEGFKPIDDIPKYTDIADVLVGCLVKSELLEATIPAKVMSYLAAGRPLALAMDGEVQRLVNDVIQCGIACPTENAQALADGIATLHNSDPETLTLMGKKARDYHFAHFERNLILDKMRAFFDL